MKPHGTNESRWSSVWNPKTDSALVDEFMDWLKKDVEKANNNRQEVPWVVGFAHKGERPGQAHNHRLKQAIHLLESVVFEFLRSDGLCTNARRGGAQPGTCSRKSISL
jgi:hypothetical protein